MVYKKYITIRGKRYGPYLYENKRVKGKVVTQYISKAPVEPSFFFHPVFIVGILFIAVFGFFTLQHFINSTGHATLSLDERLVAGQP